MLTRALPYSLLVGILSFSAACGTPSEPSSAASSEPTSLRFWVNSSKVDCAENPSGYCYSIQQGDTLAREAWESFAFEIEGFDYKPGHIYHLRVSEQPATEQTAPQYTLVELINRTPDQLLAIHNIYALEAIDGEPITLPPGAVLPRLEVNVTTNQVFGNDSCNEIFGPVTLTQGGTFEIGPLRSTRKACKHAAFAAAYQEHLQTARSFSRRPGILILRDAADKALLRFHAVD